MPTSSTPSTRKSPRKKASTDGGYYNPNLASSKLLNLYNMTSPTPEQHSEMMNQVLLTTQHYRDPKGATAKYQWDEESKVAREMATLVLKDLGFTEIEQTTLKELHDVH
ncbi:hypothetical protein C8J56DRAFT_1044934 [Mycena floridula]|nr:hypothetical protein C8J56DRAFT_1044934 [Mycena floridula]